MLVTSFFTAVRHLASGVSGGGGGGAPRRFTPGVAPPGMPWTLADMLAQVCQIRDTPKFGDSQRH